MTTGPGGVKDFVLTIVPEAVLELETLADAHDKYHCKPNEVLCVLDGNVLVRQIPLDVVSFDEYCKVFCMFVGRAMDAADAVFVVFDDAVTLAKLEEQKRRDAQSRKTAVVCSEDLDELVPKDDDFTFDELRDVNPHDVVAQRGARPRFFDAVCKRALIALTARLSRESKRLLFDGVDGRGADRPKTEPRVAAMVSNDFVLARQLERPADKLVGEGDVKITDLVSEATYLRDTNEDFHEMKLVLIVTIDTDSIAIELMHEGAKLQQKRERPDLRPPPVGLLCFRNRRAHRTPADGETPRGVYTCIDMEDAHATLQERLAAPFGYERHAISLVCVLWAVQKSDYIFTPGSKKALDRFADVCALCADRKRAKRALAPMRHSWTLAADADADARARARCALRRCFAAVLGRDAPEMTTKRAAWLAIYWHGLQLPNEQLAEWGFPPPALSAA